MLRLFLAFGFLVVQFMHISVANADGEGKHVVSFSWDDLNHIKVAKVTESTSLKCFFPVLHDSCSMIRWPERAAQPTSCPVEAKLNT